MERTPNIFTVTPTLSFADSFASALIEKHQDQPENLSKTLILLPTRRACRSVQEAFLRQSGGKPIMLPRLSPIGDVDGDELNLQGAEDINQLLPAMPSIKRKILLGQIIGRLPDFGKSPEKNIRLASALGQLIDHVYTEDLDLAQLPHIVDREDFAAHWQVTVDFLEIISVHWPQILAERGMIDAADRRNRLMNTLNKHWQKNPPNHPVIAAGSTGSIPATANLLKTISTLPQGMVILPGLDKNMSDEAWDNIEEGHPQNTLKELLVALDVQRADVKHFITTQKTYSAREQLISHAMTPPVETHKWQSLNLSDAQINDIKDSIKNVQRLDCQTAQEEAELIGVLIRETLNTPDKTVALITPNRFLARRVASICKRWDIDVDDSSGQPLNETPISIFLRLIMTVVDTQAAPIPFITLLKHELCHVDGVDNFRKNVRQMDHDLLRGLKPASGFDGLRDLYVQKHKDERNKSKPDEKLLILIEQIEVAFGNTLKKFSTGTHSFSTLLKTNIELAEDLSMGAEHIWLGDAGETAAEFLSKLMEHAKDIEDCTLHHYIEMLDHFMQSESVRSKFGTHPRVMILGQLEARLIQANRVILSGLNEGTWPPDPGHDPWMSRPMRVNFGLPKPERAITLAAHDFVQAFCNEEVFLTRAARDGGSPTVPARWLHRLDTFLNAINIDPAIMRKASHLSYVKELHPKQNLPTLERPAPTPPIEARPTRLSVTKIEKWLQDPYSIYAESILKLHALDPIEKEIGAMERGNILHELMEKFTKKYPDHIPDNAAHDFVTLSRDILEKQKLDLSAWNFWLPRMVRLSEWIVPHEQEWRKSAKLSKTEIKGEIEFTENLKRPFTLSGIADRIDRLNTGEVAIIDYKSGGAYSQKKLKNAALPQLPLEALMITKSGFEGISTQKVGYIGYWKMSGGTPAGDITAINDDKEDISKAIDFTAHGMVNLIACFEDKNTPYLAIPHHHNAPRFNDYEHLERIKEWAALDEQSEEVA
jgi:ATP-dependent helicase/nuclease subunit B